MLLNIIKKIYSSNKKIPRFPEKSNKKEIEIKSQKIYTNLEQTISTFKELYSFPINNDVNFRTFDIRSLNKKAAIILIDTIADMKIVNEFVLEPLLNNSNPTGKVEELLSIQAISKVSIIQHAVDEINKGSAVLFIDSFDYALSISVSNIHNRGVTSSENEIVLKGPKEAFTEESSINLSLIRRRIKNENLVAESVPISLRTHNVLYLVYIKDLANEQLLNNIKNRVKALKVDSIQNLPLLEQHIEERKLSLFPTILYTERPDRASSYVEDGYIVILMDNSPDCLILPATFWSFFHISEDHYLRFIYGNFTRALRMLAIFITLFTSAIYVGITTFHSEMIPPDLLLAISATREKVPLPATIEVLLMELAFGLIREGGLRVPSSIGPTIGIVGALILGQAAVQANLVSPIVVIVVALGGVCSFLVPDISMNFAIRLSRYCFIIASGLFGFFGMTVFFTMGLFYMVSLKSFGVPYLSPMTPKYTSSKDTLFRRLLKNEIFRPGYLKPKDMKKN
ncbi:spore germination protein KA [Cytobacillus eiseniae]|uniref:Spore germination protein KA n=1 Tax=Cytobacillus eiseniae TaxID=762947 RepID=A0ABS4R9U0_9BACI|nr:spore germination protein [Cytobacillus eiseniae]MBP2239663.1 spore germination protein KA [Cytobacillus eiseniae]